MCHRHVYFTLMIDDMYEHSLFLAEEPRSYKSIPVPVLLGGPSPLHPRRRDVLAYMGASLAGLAYAPAVLAQTPQNIIATRMGDGQRFDPAVVAGFELGLIGGQAENRSSPAGRSLRRTADGAEHQLAHVLT